MKNQEIAKIFDDMARFLSMDGVAFKPYAYQRAAISIGALDKDVAQLYLEGGIKALMEIPGIGKNMAEHIEEFLKTGKIKQHEEFRKKLPINLDELTKVEGMGVKKAKTLYQKLGIKNIKDLEKAAKAHKIGPLFGFGEKTEKNILQGLEFLKKDKGRSLLGYIMPTVNEVVEKLKSLKEVEKISIAGSVRRRKETIGDVDLLVLSKKADKVMDFFVKLPGVEKVWAKGSTKSSIRMLEGFDIDLRIVPARSYGSALQYFTGNVEHNILTRRLAIEKGFKLSEYGVFKGTKQIAGATEEDVYKKIGLPWIEPELRENQGEIEAALKGELPKIIGYNDLKGDLHCHTTASDGRNSIEEMVEAAIKKGYEYIGISEHTKSLGIARGQTEEEIFKENEKIKKLNEKLQKQGKNFRILHGCELNILEDGSVDIEDEVLQKLDYTIASIHSLMRMEKTEMTKRVIKAMENPLVKIIGHPTGRLIGKREEIQLDFDKILEAAKRTGTILEIDSFPDRLDLDDLRIHRAKNAGVKMVINTDAHQKEHLDFAEYGIAQARRGWAGKSDIINTLSAEGFLKSLK